MPQSAARNDQGAVAQPRDGNAGSVDGGRGLAHRAQPQPERRAVEQEPHDNDRRQRHVDQQVVAGDQAFVDRAQDGHAREGFGAGEMDGAEGLVPCQVRRDAATGKEGVADDNREAQGQDVHGDTGDDLVAPVRDAGEPVDQPEADRDRDGGNQPDPGRAGHMRDRRRGEGAGQELAFEPDVDDARAFRDQARHRTQDERRGEPQRAAGDREDVGQDLRHGPWSFSRRPGSATGRTCGPARQRTG